MHEREKKKEYYDRFFSTDENTRGDYRTLGHFPLFVRVWQYIRYAELASGEKDYMVIELGCGAGQLAEYLASEKITNYLGIDFSEEALKLAREHSSQRFILHDLSEGIREVLEREKIDIKKPIFFVATEVFEHIEKDLELISELPGGQRLIFSVPEFSCAGHVRYFSSSDEVFRRYGHLLEFIHESKQDRRYIINSIIKTKPGERCGTRAITLNIVY